MKLLRVLSEAQFLAGEDARGALVMLEPETELTDEHLEAMEECGAAGFVSDFTPARFEKPDEVPGLSYDRIRFAKLMAFAVTPRTGVRFRTFASKGGFRVRVGDDGALTPVPPPVSVKRDRSKDPDIDKTAILAALAAVGVRKDDALLVHSSLSACGHIVGGAKTIIDALIETVGEDGNLFFPTFQRSECYLNGEISKRWDHRPSDPTARASATIKWVGTLPIEFMRLYPDAPRGTHISHSWTGWGKRAAEVLACQAWDEAPFSDNSAPYKVMEMGGKILHFGSPLGRTSFMHCLETHYDFPGYSAPGFFEVRLPDGTIAWKGLPGTFFGRRETTVLDGDSRLFRAMVAEGLRIGEVKLGAGSLRLMDCRNFWETGSKVMKRDPKINLIEGN